MTKKNALPSSQVTSTGALFWSGPKRAPDPLVFNPDETTHLEYIIAAANLHAFNYGLKGESDPAVFKKVLSTIEVPDFKPKQGVKVQVLDSEPVNNDEDEESESVSLSSPLTLPSGC